MGIADGAVSAWDAARIGDLAARGGAALAMNLVGTPWQACESDATGRGGASDHAPYCGRDRRSPPVMARGHATCARSPPPPPLEITRYRVRGVHKNKHCHDASESTRRRVVRECRVAPQHEHPVQLYPDRSVPVPVPVGPGPGTRTGTAGLHRGTGTGAGTGPRPASSPCRSVGQMCRSDRSVRCVGLEPVLTRQVPNPVPTRSTAGVRVGDAHRAHTVAHQHTPL